MLPFITKAISLSHLRFLQWLALSTSHFSLPLTVRQAGKKTNQIIKMVKMSPSQTGFKTCIRVHLFEEDKV